MPDNYISPLDEYMQKNSIMYKGTEGNAYNTELDNYYIETTGYPPQDESLGNVNCTPCYTPNPPWWCEGSGCDNDSVPIEPGAIMLFLSFIFGVALIKKRFVFSRYM